MTVVRFAGVLCAVVSALCILAHATLLFRQLRGKSGSFVPVIGGVFGSAAIVAFQWGHPAPNRWLLAVPWLLDLGSGPLLVMTAAAIISARRGKP